MVQIFSFVQIGIAVLLGIVILLQQKGQGLSGAFGGGDGGFYRTKRGFEKTLFIATIILAFLFVATGVARVIIAPVPAGVAPNNPSAEAPHAGTPPEEVNSTLTTPEVQITAEPVPSGE